MRCATTIYLVDPSDSTHAITHCIHPRDISACITTKRDGACAYFPKEIPRCWQYPLGSKRGYQVNRRALPWADWVGVTSSASASDGQLLFRYARLGEQQAFTLLVKRHGPLVWGVCRRLLRSHQDAEDAFQATFLILSRKAATLRQPDALVNWLYGVAYRTALQLRSRRRVMLPMEAAQEPSCEGMDYAAWRECGNLIDQAIMQLPDNLRTVFLMSQAEELTTLVVSRRLGIPEGTVVSRLHRARKQLQKLLTRQGITSAAGAVAWGWNLSLPETVSASALQSILAATPTLAVAGLAQGVITTMFWIKWTTAAVVTVSLGLVGAGTATLLAQGRGEVAKVTAPASPQPPASDKDRLIKELQSKLMELKDREQILQQQLDVLKKQNAEVKRFLEEGIVGEASRRDKESNNEAEREARVLEEKRRAEAVRQKEDQRVRRLQNMDRARDTLTEKLEQLYQQSAALDQKAKSLAAQLPVLARHRKQLEACENVLADLKIRQIGEDSPDMKRAAALLDMERTEVKKAQDKINELEFPSSQRARIDALIKLHEKLLIELEEKLLRQQFQLDEK